MITLLPHEYMRADLDQFLVEGRRQEEVHSANKGEGTIAQRMHGYLSDIVVPTIIDDDWVFEAATQFASEYSAECFTNFGLAAEAILNRQTRLHEINARVVDFLERAMKRDALTQSEFDLPKASDFETLLVYEKLGSTMRTEAQEILGQATEHEQFQVTATLNAIHTNYEKVLPPLMFVLRRVMKIDFGLRPTASDERLLSISNSLSWYDDHIKTNHPLFPVLGHLSTFYKVARNVASHHRGLKWKPASNDVLLEDETLCVRMHVHKFQQFHRFLGYLCDYGSRAVVLAFCKRDHGIASDRLFQDYQMIFPKNFPRADHVRVKLYSD